MLFTIQAKVSGIYDERKDSGLIVHVSLECDDTGIEKNDLPKYIKPGLVIKFLDPRCNYITQRGIKEGDEVVVKFATGKGSYQDKPYCNLVGLDINKLQEEEEESRFGDEDLPSVTQPTPSNNDDILKEVLGSNSDDDLPF